MSGKEIFRKITHNVWLTAVLLLLASIGAGVISLRFAATLYTEKMFVSYLENPWIVCLNLFPGVWLAFALWFATRRAAVAFALCDFTVVGLAVASWFKMQFRNDPVMFEDVLLLKEAGNMSGRYQLFVTDEMIRALVMLIVCTVLLAIFARGGVRGRKRWLSGCVMLVILLGGISLYTDADIYDNKTQNEELISHWAATQVYVSKGFIYPFIYSVQDAIDKPPMGYQTKREAAVLEQYTDADIPAEQKVDVIGIMMEAYADFSVYDQIQFNQDPYAIYHELEQEGVSGTLVTNIFAGGTVNTERAFLTGFDNQGSFRSATNSFVRYFSHQGYTVTGSHPSYEWFYNRVNINRNLGFQSYHFMENYYNQFTDDEVAMDRILMPEIVNLHEQHKQESDTPYFSFNVTYQGHGPYGEDTNYYHTDYVVPGLYSEKTENVLNNYFGSIDDTNRNLKTMFDHYRESSDPVVIVLFGDHKPWLGDGGSVYKELGIDLDFSQSSQNFYNYYSTRYLIWANDAAKQALGRDFQGESRTIGPYFLMDEVFRQCGWQGPAYMQACRAVSDAVPVISVSGLYVQGNEVTDTLSPENEELVRQYLYLEYYERKNFHEGD